MGVLDWLRGTDTQARDLVVRSESTTNVDSILADIIARRRSGFGLEQARTIPAIARAYDIITSLSMSYQPIAYRGRIAMPSQPRIVTNPLAYGDRTEFVEQTLLSMLDEGDAFWRIHGVEDDPSRSAIVLPPTEMVVQWARRPYTRQYAWNGRALADGGELIHVSIRRRAGELRGVGLRSFLDALYPVWEAEEFAASFFTSGGIPEVVLKTAAQLTNDEAKDLKKKWVESRTGTEPAVLSGGLDVSFPAVDPQRAQLQEARSFGSTVAAILLGIPAALLHVQTSGATITYTNPAGAVEEVTKATIAPRWLVPIERAWSRLLPSTQAVRFDLADMQRADIKARFDLYKLGVETVDADGVPLMTSTEARAYEGWTPAGTEAGHQFEAVDEPSTPPIPAEATA